MHFAHVDFLGLRRFVKVRYCAACNELLFIDFSFFFSCVFFSLNVCRLGDSWRTAGASR